MESPPVTGFRGGAFDKKVKGFDFFGQTFDFLNFMRTSSFLTPDFRQIRNVQTPDLAEFL